MWAGWWLGLKTTSELHSILREEAKFLLSCTELSSLGTSWLQAVLLTSLRGTSRKAADSSSAVDRLQARLQTVSSTNSLHSILL